MVDLRLGDCLEIMDTLNSVDAIICDLPYGMTKCGFDSIIPIDKMWGKINNIIKPNGVIILFGNQPFTSKLVNSNIDMFRYEIIWHKTRNSHPFFAKSRPLPQHENILVFSNGKITYNPQMVKSEKTFKVNKNTAGKLHGDDELRKWAGDFEERNERYPNSVIQISNPSRECGLHPTQKPVALMEWLVKTYTNEGETVLDFAMGSGSTGVACVNANRNFVGIEIRDDYFSVAKDRISGERKLG